MQGLIYIHIDQEISFQFSNKLQELTKLFPKAAFFELDNFSDSLIMKYASDFIDQYKSVVVVMEIADGNPPLHMLSLFNKLLKKQRCDVFLQGNHEQLKVLLRPFEHVYTFQDFRELKEKLLALFH